MPKVIIDVDERTRITIETPTEETADAAGVFCELDLADFDGEAPPTCEVVGCRRAAVCSIELIDDDGSQTIGRYCERHGDLDE